MANTLPIKVDAVLVEILTQHKEDSGGVLPYVKLRQYLEESPSYRKDYKEHMAKKIKEQTPHAS